MSARARDVNVNGSARPLAGLVVSDLVREMGLADRPGIAVAVNGEVVPRAAWTGRRLAPGDDVEIVGAAQGG